MVGIGNLPKIVYNKNQLLKVVFFMRAIIFDLDGTLLNTRERIFWQFEELTREFDGAPASRKEIAAAMKGTTEEVVRNLIKRDDVSAEALMKRYSELYSESLKQLQLYKGVDELLPILKRIGIQLAAITSSDERIVPILEMNGIRKYFSVVVHSGHVTNPRPHPEGLNLVLDHLAVRPEHAVMVGDMVDDIVAGKAANMAKTIAVTHGFGRVDDLKQAAPDHLIDDIPSLLDVLDVRVGA